MAYTKDAFKARVHNWAQQLNVEPKTISLRIMKNKWASYTRNSGLLIFNSELLRMKREIGDYVIVHELLHINIPNHGKLWKSLMLAHLGDYEMIEKKIKMSCSGKV